MWGILHGSFVCDALALQLWWTPGHRSHTWTGKKNRNFAKKYKTETISDLWGRHWRHSFSWNPSSSSVLNFFPQPRHTLTCGRVDADESWKDVPNIDIRKLTQPLPRIHFLFELGWLGITFKCERTLWVRACMARPSSSSQSCKMTSGRSFPQNILLSVRAILC